MILLAAGQPDARGELTAPSATSVIWLATGSKTTASRSDWLVKPWRRTPEQTTTFLAPADVSGGKPPAGHLTRRQAHDALADILTEERHKIGQRAYDHLGATFADAAAGYTCITSSMSAAAGARPSATTADR